MNGAFPLPPRESRTARFVARWGRSGTVVTVNGELDAANVGQLADYAQRCTACCEWLVLDLSDLEFMGTAGFSALHMINTRCASAQVNWALVPGLAVSRLLRVCDPDTRLPMAESVTVALATVQDRQRLLQLLAEPR